MPMEKWDENNGIAGTLASNNGSGGKGILSRHALLFKRGYGILQTSVRKIYIYKITESLPKNVDDVEKFSVFKASISKNRYVPVVNSGRETNRCNLSIYNFIFLDDNKRFDNSTARFQLWKIYIY